MLDSEVSTSIDAVLGLILSNIRKSKKISQENSAECLGVTKQAISNMENGRSKFAVAQVYQLCAFYEVEPKKVFEALDEALKSENINILGINGTAIGTVGATLGLVGGVALINPIVVGVTLAGFLGAKFMKKLTDVSPKKGVD